MAWFIYLFILTTIGRSFAYGIETGTLGVWLVILMWLLVGIMGLLSTLA